MVKEKRVIGFLFLALGIFFTSSAYSQTESPALHQRPVISILGRLSLEKHGESEWLVLHAKNAETYQITGNLGEKLKDSLLELGEKNLVFVTGNQDGKYNIACERIYSYKDNKQGERELKIDTKCIRYYNLEVSQILFAKKSDEEIPPAKRDSEEERKAANNLTRQTLSRPVMGEIYAKITSINLKSALKTVEAANRDKNSPIEKITLMITADTHIAKKMGEAQEPVSLKAEALKAGQEITAVYSKDEFKTEAIYITITKE